MKTFNTLILIPFFLLICSYLPGQGSYDNFKVSVYTRAQEVSKMNDPKWLDSTWQVISSQLDVDKIYLETHRDSAIVDAETLDRAIRFFRSKGLEVAGGITYTINEGNFFQTYCYSNPLHREKVKEIMEYTASRFDEVILDDFFFTSCKCELCVNAKGDRGWSDYRLELMTGAARDLIINPARQVNPDVKVIIKYPNWYDHFHELGFNLETQPALFDGLYTGTETRNAVLSNQHLQPYLGYLIFRYFNNLKPGKNGGGWVDTGGMSYFDRYSEQLWLTILAGAPEMTLFDYRQMLYPLRQETVGPWSDLETSFNYESFLPLKDQSTVASLASHSLQIIDEVAGELGEPFGVKSYKPFHSDGEDFLQNYMGMIGIPVDLVPEFPMDGEMLILTEQAKKDPEIVEKIRERLLSGNDVLITSGLLRALQDRGIRELVNLEYTDRKSLVEDFLMNWRMVEGKTPILIPQISYFTNDSWEIISGMDSGLGWPLLHQADFGNAKLYMLTIPENFADLYNLPDEVLNRIREIVAGSTGITIQGPPGVSLFLYDNNRLVVESFNDEVVDINIVFNEKPAGITDLLTGKFQEVETIPEFRFRGRLFSPEKYSLRINIPPHSFRVFGWSKSE